MLVRYYGPVGVATGERPAASPPGVALIQAGVDLEIQTYSPSGAAENQLPMRYGALASCVRHDGAPPRPNPDVVIVHTLPVDCAKVLEVAKIRELYPSALCIAYTAWEARTLPDAVIKSLAQFDKVWVPSSPVMDVFRQVGNLRAFVVPHAYDELTNAWTPPQRPRASQAPFVFYTIGAWTRRKNPHGVVRAFLRAFEPGEAVRLKIHAPKTHRQGDASWQGDASMTDLAELVVAETGRAPNHMPITLTTDYAPEHQIWDLHNTSDCFVTASRGEAWNLPAFDAMLARRHIISPRLGSDDFLRFTSAWISKSTLAPAGGEARVHMLPTGQIGIVPMGTDITVKDDWWEPDIADLARLMRRAFAERVSDLELYDNPAVRYGRRAVGRLLMTRLMER